MAELHPSDDALMASLADRDLGALASLYDRYGRLAYSLAYRSLGESEAAEDVVQDAFLSAWRGQAPTVASGAPPGRGSYRSSTTGLSTSSAARRPSGLRPLSWRKPSRATTTRHSPPRRTSSTARSATLSRRSRRPSAGRSSSRISAGTPTSSSLS